jgi:acyl-CoA reductase-like NAD-dependent aldehyde dehydrogenase
MCVETSTFNVQSTDDSDPIQAVASHQVEWRNLPVSEKIVILQELKSIWNKLTMNAMASWFGQADAQAMGHASTVLEGQFEAAQAAFFYVLVVKGTVTKLLDAYQYHHDQSLSASSAKRPFHPLQQTEAPKSVNDRQTIVPTSPLFWSDRLFGPFIFASVEVWLKSGAPLQPLAVNHFLQGSEDTSKEGCMVVLAAGNHCFLSTIDCLHGLFQCNRVVYLKHSPVRPHHDALVRHLFAPLIRRGYFGCELDTTLARSQQLVYHPSVAHVHLTGGKSVHDAIVWGTSDIPRPISNNTPVLRAKMTSELGCVTPWIIAPDQRWTKRQLRHHARHLFASLYHNAGANCNSPKVLVLPRDWSHARELVSLLIALMKKHPLPVSYYPGTRNRWMAFRNAYHGNLAKEYGEAFSAQQRPLLDAASEWLLPWLVVDGIHVDLSTQKGREAARTEYAFQNEPFAPVLTIAYIDDNSLETAVTLANDYLFGSLSCSIVAPQSSTPAVEQAIANLRYGAVAVNCWSGLCYLALCGTWGAFPGETLDNVQSGIGQVHNAYFIRDIEKTVLRSAMIDPILHLLRKPLHVARNEYLTLGDWVLQPGLYTLSNVVAVKLTGYALPTRSTFWVLVLAVLVAATLVIVCAIVGVWDK